MMQKEMSTMQTSCPSCDGVNLSTKQELLFCDGCNIYLGRPETLAGVLSASTSVSYYEYIRKLREQQFDYAEEENTYWYGALFTLALGVTIFLQLGLL